MDATILIDGEPPTLAGLAGPALVNDGHFTAMQVRDGAVRGLGHHLARLVDAHAELYGTQLDAERVRACMRAAIAGRPDGYLRVTVLEPEPGVPRVLTVLRAPVDPSPEPQSLRPVTDVRSFAHLKHVGTFAQIRHGLAAERDGYDDALLVAPDGRICETTIANLAFLDGGTVVWPDGPALHGITWQLLDGALAAAGTPSARRAIRLEDVPAFDGAILANSIGVMPVGRIAEHRYSDAAETAAPLIARYDALPWDRI